MLQNNLRLYYRSEINTLHPTDRLTLHLTTGVCLIYIFVGGLCRDLHKWPKLLPTFYGCVYVSITVWSHIVYAVLAN